ncbi:phytanoyl-CoA dioxygenase family protein [Sphingopyxis sp. JAI108]|uniref:phytanoyl-CoA dioxygenase family protein n=1 Tax=Sphingopyxis sp. JAI108 TaxID=2723060 RepID=UPI0015C791CE|nr:phytanoyl-CoA dioxygenase family protein [Sphingopyxis sp. JAI108]NYF32472.1 ectoine hydroxylase-related dioxygenase (phytanoyl-CoA dioxygenase family) [Sphingopyxis sp. JAI108]
MDYSSDVHHLTLAKDGAEHFHAAALSALPDIRAALQGLPTQRAGVRIHGIKPLMPILAADGSIGSLASKFLGPRCRPVRAILFDKNAITNWSLAWHQDRTICVKQRIEVDGYGPWTTKGRMQHVAPPFDLLARMLTLRVHLDDVPTGNSPLLIAPGSHKVGRVPISEYDEVVRQCGTYFCLANAGDVWVYATPILHASEAASVIRNRRVLQVDYSADELGGGLEWLGV